MDPRIQDRKDRHPHRDHRRGITEVNGVFLYSNSGWNAGEPAFSVADATLNLFGVNERNFNRQPVTLWVRERQGAETRELVEMPWVFLGK